MRNLLVELDRQLRARHEVGTRRRPCDRDGREEGVQAARILHEYSTQAVVVARGLGLSIFVGGHLVGAHPVAKVRLECDGQLRHLLAVLVQLRVRRPHRCHVAGLHVGDGTDDDVADGIERERRDARATPGCVLREERFDVVAHVVPPVYCFVSFVTVQHFADSWTIAYSPMEVQARGYLYQFRLDAQAARRAPTLSDTQARLLDERQSGRDLMIGETPQAAALGHPRHWRLSQDLQQAGAAIDLDAVRVGVRPARVAVVALGLEVLADSLNGLRNTFAVLLRRVEGAVQRLDVVILSAERITLFENAADLLVDLVDPLADLLKFVIFHNGVPFAHANSSKMAWTGFVLGAGFGRVSQFR